MHEGDDNVTNAKRHPADAEGRRDGQRDQQESAHADQQQQPDHQPARWNRVREPGVAAVHPPDVAEEEHHLEQAAKRRIAEQQAGQLGDREDEYQVEEQLERADAWLGRACRIWGRDGRLH